MDAKTKGYVITAVIALGAIWLANNVQAIGKVVAKKA